MKQPIQLELFSIPALVIDEAFGPEMTATVLKHFQDRKSLITHAGKIAYYLNEKLAEKQGVTDQEMINLVDLHQYKLAVFDVMSSTDDPVELKRNAKLVEEIEFEMQKNWHFPLDKTFHEWYKVPKCTCPKMDNEDRRGTTYQIIDAKCPIHGEPR